jgi:hypothetical protein
VLTGAFRNAAGALPLLATPSDAGPPVRAEQEESARFLCSGDMVSAAEAVGAHGRRRLDSIAVAAAIGACGLIWVQLWRVWARRRR